MMLWKQPVWWDALPVDMAGVSFSRNEPLAKWTSLKVGGPAQVWMKCTDWDALAAFLRFKAASEALKDVPLTILGAGTNSMIRDGGIAGIVVRLAPGFDTVELRDGNRIYAEAGASCGKVARAARDAGLAGLAFYAGIPGNIGGALRMNAGAYKGETYDKLETVLLMTPTGEVVEREGAFVKPRYRHTELPAGWIYKGAVWVLEQGDRDEILQQMRAVNQSRTNSQPLHMPSSGSWFKNPMVNGEKQNAWRMVDAAGCRGMTVGGAMVSDMHANFFVNAGGAKASDFDELSRVVERTILEKLGVTMEREVRFTGVDESAMDAEV